jgi:hypothetical protein
MVVLLDFQMAVAAPPLSSLLMDVPSNPSLSSMVLHAATHEWQWQLKTIRGSDKKVASNAPHLHFRV